ncbi:unnamed protein product [Trichobilharzia regenti]|nr:unnamed protein product [Trichobilharzia regenti]
MDYFKQELDEDVEDYNAILPSTSEEGNSESLKTKCDTKQNDSNTITITTTTTTTNNYNNITAGKDNKNNSKEESMESSRLSTPKITSLFSSKSHLLVNTEKDESKKHLLVPSSPESNHSETFPHKSEDGDNNENVVDVLWTDDFIEQLEESDIVENNEEFSSVLDDDILLSEAVKAAEAAEVKWLTEGLIKESDFDTDVDL